MHPTVQMRDVWTIPDLAELDVPDWWRYEILDGALVVTPSAGRAHEYAGEELRARIRAAQPDQWTVLGPIGVTVDTGSYFIPDLVVTDRTVLAGAGDLAPAEVHLAVEIESPGSASMDRIVKPAKFAAAGIPHYWRLETEPLRLSAYRLDGGVYSEVGVWAADETATLTQPFAIVVEISTLLA